MICPDTISRLERAGYSPLPLETAANHCFNAVGMAAGKIVRSALYSSDKTTWQFWKEFMDAHRLLRGGEEMMEAA